MMKKNVKLRISMAVLVMTLLLSPGSSEEMENKGEDITCMKRTMEILIKCMDGTMEFLKPCLVEIHELQTRTRHEISLPCCDVITQVVGDCAGERLLPEWFMEVHRMCIVDSTLSEQDRREYEMSLRHDDDDDADADDNDYDSVRLDYE